MATIISSTEAARKLGDCLARIKHTGETFVLSKNDKPIAVLGPLPSSKTTTLRQLWESLQGLPSDPGFADDLDRVNLADQALKDPWA
jgi:antitoxin (DNA-binding transcriptional repressor) of toxin-antitoxin stability system